MTSAALRRQVDETLALMRQLSVGDLVVLAQSLGPQPLRGDWATLLGLLLRAELQRREMHVSLAGARADGASGVN